MVGSICLEINTWNLNKICIPISDINEEYAGRYYLVCATQSFLSDTLQSTILFLPLILDQLIYIYVYPWAAKYPRNNLECQPEFLSSLDLDNFL